MSLLVLFFVNPFTMNGQNLVKVWLLLGLASCSLMAGLNVPVRFTAALKSVRQWCESAGMPTFASCCLILLSHSNLVARFLVGFHAFSMVLMSSWISVLSSWSGGG